MYLGIVVNNDLSVTQFFYAVENYQRFVVFLLICTPHIISVCVSGITYIRQILVIL